LKKKRKKIELRKSQEIEQKIEETKPKLEIPKVKKAKKSDFPLVSPIILKSDPNPVILSVSQQIRNAEEKDRNTTFTNFGTSWFE